MSDRTLRLLLVDDSEADAELIAEHLRASGLEVEYRRAYSREGFRRALHDLAPDVVLSDHGLAGFSALDALRLLKQEAPTTPFIMVSGAPHDRLAVSSLRAGADDLVYKGALEELGPAIERALDRRVGLRSLSPRQVEVLRYIVGGHTTPEIAERLGLSVKTVQTHRVEMMRRLGVHDVSGLVRYAASVGLVPLNSD